MGTAGMKPVTEWLLSHDPGRVFLNDGDRRVTYGEVSHRVSGGSGPIIESVRPSLDIESVVKLLTSMSSGTVVVHPPHLPKTGVGWVRGASMVVFTSGSTGKPKGVRLTSANWTAAAESSVAHLGHGPDDVWLLAMPLHHVAGIGIILRSAYAGGGVRILPDFEPSVFARALREVTMASLVPTMLSLALEVDPGPYEGLRAVLVGGGPIPDGLLEKAAAAGLPALPTYGMTETCGQIATLRPGSPVANRAHPLPGVDIRIRDDDRILVRGPMVSPGYVDEPDRDPDSYFLTGDLGRFDRDGALIVIGRADDVIITGGEKVSPAEVEKGITSIDGVDHVVVVGLASDRWGTEVGCVYAGTVDEVELRSQLMLRLPGFMVPKRIVKVDELPVTGAGKVDKSGVRSLLLDDSL